MEDNNLYKYGEGDLDEIGHVDKDAGKGASHLHTPPTVREKIHNRAIRNLGIPRKPINWDEYDEEEIPRIWGKGIPPFIETEEFAQMIIKADGQTVRYKIPDGRTYTNFQSSVRQYLMRRGYLPVLANGGDVIYGKLRK